MHLENSSKAFCDLWTRSITKMKGHMSISTLVAVGQTLICIFITKSSYPWYNNYVLFIMYIVTNYVYPSFRHYYVFESSSKLQKACFFWRIFVIIWNSIKEYQLLRNFCLIQQSAFFLPCLCYNSDIAHFLIQWSKLIIIRVRRFSQ